MSEPEIVELSAEQTHPLRRAVLRFDTPTKEVVFPEDTWPGALHLGVLLDGELVATSSWVPRPLAGNDLGSDNGNDNGNDKGNDKGNEWASAVQLRGMATAHAHQGSGMGGLLLQAGCERHAAAGARVVWARARDAALAFYVRHGFEPEGDGFIDAATQLPHHLVVRHLVVGQPAAPKPHVR